MSRTTTIVLVVILAALALYVVLVQNPRDQAAADLTPTVGPAQVVFNTTGGQIVSLRVSEPGANRSVVVTKDAAGAWAVTEPAAGPADSDRMTSLTNSVALLSVTTVVTGTTDLAQFGVLSPTYTLELGLADGQTLKAAVGNATAVGSGYYLLREGDANAMVVPSFGLEALIELLNTPPYAATATPAATIAITPGTPEDTLAPDPTPTP